MNKKKLVMIMFTLVMFFFTSDNVLIVEAKPAKATVKKAYKMQLKKDGYAGKFNEGAFIDVNDDGIPEYCYCNGGEENDIAYTYYKGKVRQLSNMTHVDFVKIGKKKYVELSDHFGMYYTFSILKKGKLIEQFEVYQGGTPWDRQQKYYYKKKGAKAKRISEKKFNKYTSYKNSITEK